MKQCDFLNVIYYNIIKEQWKTKASNQANQLK